MKLKREEGERERELLQHCGRYFRLHHSHCTSFLPSDDEEIVIIKKIEIDVQPGTVVVSVLPRPFQHSGPLCLLQPCFFDVVTKMIDVVTNSAQATPTRSALNFSWGEPWLL